MQKEFSTGRLTLIASMGALGNVLGVIAISLSPIPISGIIQVGLDFSNLAVVIVAIFLGWRYGAATGLLAGLGPSVMFGFVSGSTGFISFLVSVGKALTGLTVGLISLRMGNRKLKSYGIIGAILVGFIPEAILTWYYFTTIVPLFISGYFGQVFAPTLALPVLVKSWVEMIIISFVTVGLLRNEGFRTFFTKHLGVESLSPSISHGK